MQLQQAERDVFIQFFPLFVTQQNTVALNIKFASDVVGFFQITLRMRRVQRLSFERTKKNEK